MAPKPLRGPTRKQASQTPEMARFNHLADCAKLLAASAPQLAHHLGQSALRFADASRLPVPQRTAQGLCGRCGIALTKETCSR